MQLDKFLSQILKLKKIPRTGWLLAGIENPESVSEHCFDVVIITKILSEVISSKTSVDKEKALCIALLHDIPETMVGDTPRGQDPNKEQKERKAMDHLFSYLPELKDHFMEVWDCASDDCLESNLVKLADNISMLLQAREYKKSDPDNPKLKEIEASAQKSIKKYLKKIPELEVNFK